MRHYFSRYIDLIAARLGIWALRRIYGADCPEDDYNAGCFGCETRRLIANLKDLW